ncbi:hypothetical protein JOM56_003795 [Amanita muscaria]
MPEPCPLPHAEPCTLLHIDPCTLSHAEPCTLPHNDICALNHFPVEPVTVAVTIPCPLAHNDLCTKEHVPTRLSSPTPVPSVPIPLSPVNQSKRILVDSSSAKQMKRKCFKSNKKRKVTDIDQTQVLAKRYGSEPEMDSDGFFANPNYGYREALDDFMKNEDDSDHDSALLDREMIAIDRELQQYGNPELLGYPPTASASIDPPSAIPALLPPTPPTAPPASLDPAPPPAPKVSLPRAWTEPLPSNPVITSLPQRAQTAPPDVSRNTLTARRCTTKMPHPHHLSNSWTFQLP